MLIFGTASMRMQFDGLADDELELPMNFHRSTADWDLASVMLLPANGGLELSSDALFKVRNVLVRSHTSVQTILSTRRAPDGRQATVDCVSDTTLCQELQHTRQSAACFSTFE